MTVLAVLIVLLVILILTADVSDFFGKVNELGGRR